MKDFMKVSPLRILERSSHKGLGRGNLGALMAWAGVGKTACLIHMAFDKLFRKEKLVHVSLEDVPEKVTSYYNVIFSDLVKAMDMDNEYEMRMLFERNRMILAYLSQSFEIKRLRENLKNLIEKIEFVPDTLIVDGLNFEKTDREIFEGFKEIATQFDVEIWFSALSHRHITDVNERGIPYPCNQIDDLFNIIIQLQPTQSGIFLKLLKDHESQVMPDASVRLDPNTFLAMT
jgi:uncharacterized protein YlzI (FlbEa/FlbD family)